MHEYHLLFAAPTTMLYNDKGWSLLSYIRILYVVPNSEHCLYCLLGVASCCWSTL